MKNERIIFIILNSIVLSLSMYFYINLNINLVSTFLFIVYGFLGLLYILYKEVRKIEYKRYMYSEAYYIFVIIIGTLFLYLNNKFNMFGNKLLYILLSSISFIVLPGIFYLVTILKNKKNKGKNGPKFIAKN